MVRDGNFDEPGDGTSLTTVPTTRYGEPICGYRQCKNGHTRDGRERWAYLFAVLPNPDVPIGELMAGSLIGTDSEQKYLKLCKEIRKMLNQDAMSHSVKWFRRCIRRMQHATNSV